MNKLSSFIGATLLLSSLPLAAIADPNGVNQHQLSLPLVELNNPCTAGHDSIDGSLDLHGVTQHSEGVTFLRVNAHGSAVDAKGIDYQVNGQSRFQFHDLLPATVYLRLKLTSQGSGDNARLALALHVNEQGHITRAEYSGVECLG